MVLADKPKTKMNNISNHAEEHKQVITIQENTNHSKLARPLFLLVVLVMRWGPGVSIRIELVRN